MDILYAVIVVVGLVVFETIASIDNAIINADILSTMSAWAKRWFLTWGLIIAVFGVRGILPWLIIWFSIIILCLVNRESIDRRLHKNRFLEKNLPKASL